MEIAGLTPLLVFQETESMNDYLCSSVTVATGKRKPGLLISSVYPDCQRPAGTVVSLMFAHTHTSG
jgi:hypothetical protein